MPPAGFVCRVVLWLDEAVGPEHCQGPIAHGGGVCVRVVEEVLMCHEATKNEHPGPVRPIDAGRNPLLSEFFVDGVEAAVKFWHHNQATTRRAAMDVEAVG